MDLIEQMHPDEQDFVAIVTRGHKHDADCIRTLYASGITPAYMGLICSIAAGKLSQITSFAFVIV